LENPLIQNMIEDDNGVYWFGASGGSNITGGGVYRFDSRAKFDRKPLTDSKMFVHYRIGDAPSAKIFSAF
jgi:hypothetical protein